MELQEKAVLALQVVEKAKANLGCVSFRRMPRTDYVVESLILEFKTKYVFPTKEHLRDRDLYKRGMLNWEELKHKTHELFLKQLKSCNQEAVNAFFRIRR